MASCVVCHNERGWFWRTVIAMDWVECQVCHVRYCGKCFQSLEEATMDDRWRRPVRICRECEGDIIPSIFFVQ